ncbi:MAG: NrsF family protein [Sandaracinaceae bacterium]|nr:NrsF family protein [Sandaracinaceae bacterium]
MLASAWQGLEGDLATERGLGGRLRRLPTAARLALAAVVGLVAPLLVMALAPREDLASASIAHGAVWVLALLPLLAAGAALVTRPLQVRAVQAPRALGLAAAAVLVAGLLALLPLDDAGHDPSGHPASVCALASFAVGVSAWLVVRVLRRDALGASVGAAVVAATSALMASTLVCPMDGLGHVGPGHVLPVLVLALVGVAIDRRG